MLAAVGFTAVATAACTSPSNSAAAPAVTTPSASSGTGAAADEGAGSAPSPSASPTASPTATTKKPATGQGGQGPTDWKRAAFKTLGCKRTDLPPKADGSSVVFADLTGDGRNEAIVKGSCPTTTSTNELHVFVYGAGNPDTVLLDIGKGHYLREASVDVNGRTIAVKATALSDDAPRCCPDITITQRWKWTGSGFTTEGPVTKKIG
jgi:hypothetical protein